MGWIFLTGICPAGSSIPRSESSNPEDISFYLRLKNDEFMQLMVPEEKYLLGLVRNVKEEIESRKSYGNELFTTGSDPLISQRQMFLNTYALEIEKVSKLLGELSRLEAMARKRINWQALEILAGLRKQASSILENQSPLRADSLLVNETGQQEKSNPDQKVPTGSVYTRESPSVSRKFAETLLDQWKYNHLLQNKLTRTRFELVRAKLLNSAAPQDAQRMFQRDLKSALESYAAGDFALSRIQLRDVIGAYPGIPVVDDVFYYSAESSFGLNFLDEALETYRQLTARYPNSGYSAKALSKMIFIYYTYGKSDSMVQIFQRLQTFQKMAPAPNVLEDEAYSEVSYLVGLAEFNSDSFGKALAVFQQVPTGTAYEPPAQYLSAACYSNLGNDDAALAIYTRLAERPVGRERNPIELQVKNNALMKMGFIYYERGDNRRAISLFNQVDKEFQYNDLNLLGKAWSAYRSGKPVEALENAEALLKYSVFSNYLYEAKILAARSKELLGQSDAALLDLEQVRNAGASPLSDRWSVFLQNPAADTAGTKEIEAAETLKLYNEASRIFRFVHGRTISVFPSETSDTVSTKESSRLDGKISVLDSLERLAEGRRSLPTLDIIRKLRGNAIQTLQSQDRMNIFRNAEEPIIRRMGMSAYLRYLFGILLEETVTEKKKIRSYIEEMDRMAKEPRPSGPAGLGIQMEIRRDELTDTWLKFNQYEVWLRENMPQSFRVEIDRWANFSEYGISNINFSRIREIDSQMAELSSIVRQIDRVYKAKKIELGKRIEALLEDVTLIEKQMEAEIQKKTDEEDTHRFNSDYFEKSRRESPISEPSQKSGPGKEGRP